MMSPSTQPAKAIKEDGKAKAKGKAKTKKEKEKGKAKMKKAKGKAKLMANKSEAKHQVPTSHHPEVYHLPVKRIECHADHTAWMGYARDRTKQWLAGAGIPQFAHSTERRQMQTASFRET